MNVLDYALGEDLAELAEVAAEYLSERADDSTAGTELGWFGVGIPEEYGGAGGSRAELAVLIEAAGAAHAAAPLGFTSGVVGQLLLATGGQGAASHLEELSSGALRPLVPAVDPRGIARQISPDASGVVTGEFLAYGSENANVIALPVGGESDRVILLDVTAAGVAIMPAKAVDISRPLFTVRLTGALLSDARLVLSGNAIDLMTALCALSTALDSAGVAKRALADTLSFAAQRNQFGRPIASFQAYKHRVADAYVLLRLAQSAAFRAAHEGGLHNAYAAAMDGLRNATRICGEAVQLHGAMGFSWETGVHVYLKRARANELFWQDTIRTMGAPTIEEV